MANKNVNQKAWDDMAKEFQHKSDRATALLDSVYLEVQLGQLIACFLVDNPEETQQLLGEEKPLGNLNARIKAAYCMGLISTNEYHDLQLISQIRGKFANETEIVSFAENGIRELCFQLKIPREVLLPNETRTPRHLFVFTSTILAQHLALRSEQAHNQRRENPEEFMLIDVD